MPRKSTSKPRKAAAAETGTQESRVMTLSAVAKATGKSPRFMLNLISTYELTNTKEFSRGYAVLLSKITALLLSYVTRKDVHTLLMREKNLLHLLCFDSIGATPTWFEDLCVLDTGPTRLLLSGADLGHLVQADGVQTGLDFTRQETELFDSKEMGVDVLRSLRLYAETHQGILERIRAEKQSIAASMKWLRAASKKK